MNPSLQISMWLSHRMLTLHCTSQKRAPSLNTYNHEVSAEWRNVGLLPREASVSFSAIVAAFCSSSLGLTHFLCFLFVTVWLSRVHGTWGGWGLQWGGHNLWQALWPVEPWSHPVHHAERLPTVRRPLWWWLWLGIGGTLSHLPGENLKHCNGHYGDLNNVYSYQGQPN